MTDIPATDVDGRAWLERELAAALHAEHLQQLDAAERGQPASTFIEQAESIAGRLVARAAQRAREDRANRSVQFRPAADGGRAQLFMPNPVQGRDPVAEVFLWVEDGVVCVSVGTGVRVADTALMVDVDGASVLDRPGLDPVV